jgi:integrase
VRAVISEAVIADLHRESSTVVRDVWDTTVRGLVLRILPSGRASWFVRAWTAAGQRTSIKIGEHPALKAADARKLALVQLGAIQQGRDPNGEHRTAREAHRTAAAAITVEKALADWQQARTGATGRPWSRSYIYRIESALRTHIPKRIRTQPLREVQRETWTRLLAGVAQATPGAGAFLYTIVSSFLSYAEIMGWIESHPLPRRGRTLIAPHVAPRTRVLGDHEWLAVWQAAEREPPKLRVFMRLLLLTATRVSETADISVGEMVADGTIWVIPASRTKNGREHVVPLNDLAQRELRLVWPQDTGKFGGAWMLLGRSPGHGFVGNGKLLRRLFQTSHTKDWTWHDLRRTARTSMTYLGISEADAEAALNHLMAKSKLVNTYDQSGPSASAITAIRAWQSYMAEVVEGHRPPGDAEARYREALPEELRYRAKRPRLRLVAQG